MAGDLTRSGTILRRCAPGGRRRAGAHQATLRRVRRRRALPAAASYGEDYLRKHPGDTELRYALGTVYIALGDAPIARSTLEQVVEERPELAGAHYALATVMRGQGDALLEADRHFREYIRLEPDGPYAEAARASLLKSVR